MLHYDGTLNRVLDNPASAPIPERHAEGALTVADTPFDAREPRTRTKHLGAALRMLRRERDLSQRQVAEALGVGRAMVSRWERDKAVPSLSRLGQLADLLDLDLGDLDDALAIVNNRPLPPRRAAMLRNDANPHLLVKLMLGSPGLLPHTPAEKSLTALLSHFVRLLRQLQGKDPAASAFLKKREWPETQLDADDGDDEDA